MKPYKPDSTYDKIRIRIKTEVQYFKDLLITRAVPENTWTQAGLDEIKWYEIYKHQVGPNEIHLQTAKTCLNLAKKRKENYAELEERIKPYVNKLAK